MADETATPAADWTFGGRPEMPPHRTADERTLLDAFLDWYREGAIAKLEGLTQAQTAQRHVPSETTMIGLLHHLTLVEGWWFGQQFAGEDERAPWNAVDWDATPDWEFTTARDLSVDEVVAGFKAACDRSRAVVAGASLDDLGATVSDERGAFSLRWMYLHLIEEYARHLGHLDILRELTDGAVGE